MTTRYAQRPSRHRPSLESVTVAEAMHRGVVACPPDVSLLTVARLMAAHRIHAVVVSGERDGTWSLVSDLDLVAAAAERSPAEIPASRVASAPDLTVSPGDSLARAAQLMRDYDTHHLIVTRHGLGRPVGMISTLDVADGVAELPEHTEVER